MKNTVQKGITWMKVHRVLTLVVLIVVVGGMYGITKAFGDSSAETRYVLAKVERGNIISSVSGTGQVSASEQVDITANASGNLLYLNATAGQSVTSGALIGQIDSGDAAYELETARLSYDDLLTVDPSELQDDETAVTNAKGDLENSYTNARFALTTASTKMADVMTGVNDLLSGYLDTVNNFSISENTKDYIERTESAYYDADKLLRDFTKKYRSLSTTTSREDIEAMVNESYSVSVSVAQAAKYAQDAVIYKKDREDKDSKAADDAYTTVNSLISSANSVVDDLSSTKSSLTTGKKAVEKAESDLDDLEKGPDELDVRQEELSLKQKQDALDNYYIRAPFSGILAAVDAKKGEHVSSGSTIATLITKQKIAEISLNEIDVEKVKVGQKATLTFDAVEGLTITGEVAEVGMIGSVDQGVVSYPVKISFDTDDERIKPGMTVSANIITQMKQGVLTVPTSAVKTQGGASYVDVVDQENVPASAATGVPLSTPPTPVEVVTGLSDDENVEIVSGLTEGEQYVARTITTGGGATSQPAQSTPSLFGGGAAGGRAVGGFSRGGGSFSR